MENMTTKITSSYNNALDIKVVDGHFATNHSHINRYIDMTTIKSRRKMALAAAKDEIINVDIHSIASSLLLSTALYAPHYACFKQACVKSRLKKPAGAFAPAGCVYWVLDLHADVPRAPDDGAEVADGRPRGGRSCPSSPRGWGRSRWR